MNVFQAMLAAWAISIYEIKKNTSDCLFQYTLEESRGEILNHMKMQDGDTCVCMCACVVNLANIGLSACMWNICGAYKGIDGNEQAVITALWIMYEQTKYLKLIFLQGQT